MTDLPLALAAKLTQTMTYSMQRYFWLLLEAQQAKSSCWKSLSFVCRQHLKRRLQFTRNRPAFVASTCLYAE